MGRILERLALKKPATWSEGGSMEENPKGSRKAGEGENGEGPINTMVVVMIFVKLVRARQQFLVL